MSESHFVVAMLIDAVSGEYIIVDPPQSRQYDFIHAKYIYSLVPKLFTRKFIGGGEIYNIGSGEERKISWLANSVRHLLDSPAKVKMVTPEEESKLFEPRGYHSKMDIQKAKTFLNYDPDGISVQHFLETARWVQYHISREEGRRTRDIEDIYPTLREDFDSSKVVDNIPDSDIK